MHCLPRYCYSCLLARDGSYHHQHIPGPAGTHCSVRILTASPTGCYRGWSLTSQTLPTFQSHPESLEQHALVQGHHLEKVRRGHYWRPTQQLSKTVALWPGPLPLTTSNCHQPDNKADRFSEGPKPPAGVSQRREARVSNTLFREQVLRLLFPEVWQVQFPQASVPGL